MVLRLPTSLLQETETWIERIIGCAIEVHRTIGPGFIERIYEVKAVAAFDPIHQAKVMSYLRTTGCRTGLLVNFHARLLKEGLKRIVM